MLSLISKSVRYQLICTTLKPLFSFNFIPVNRHLFWFFNKTRDTQLNLLPTFAGFTARESNVPFNRGGPMDAKHKVKILSFISGCLRIVLLSASWRTSQIVPITTKIPSKEFFFQTKTFFLAWGDQVPLHPWPAFFLNDKVWLCG